MLNAADFDHRCTEPECCNYGKTTTSTSCLCHKPREEMLLDAIASARAEGWKAGRDAAAEVGARFACNPKFCRAAILALEEPRHE